MNMSDFFFLRPLWLLLLIPVAVLLWYLLRGARSTVTTPWQKLVDPHLLKHLVLQPAQSAGSSRRQRVGRLSVLGIALIAVCVALAGPAWQRNELPTYKSHTPVVMVLSLAQSMNATDISPDRLTRAEHKVRDVMERNKGGDMALVVYSDQPFVAAPLTSDAKVIGDMLPELSTSLMPVLGNRLDLAIDEATQLLARADARQGQILVLADDAGESAELAVAAAERAADAGYSVNVLGVGTEQGAALQTSSGKTITNQDGQSYTTRLETDFLTDVSSAGNGHFAALSPDGSDLDAALADTSATGLMSSSRQEELHADTWNDMGYWLVFVPLLLAPLAFRKNLLLAILPAVLAMNLLTAAPTAQAEVQIENGGSISGVEPANVANTLPVDPAAGLAANAAPDATTPDATTPAVIDTTANDTVPSSNDAPGQTKSAWAKKWRNLWLTPDQQAARDFQANNYQAAAQNFDNTDWKASAMYREGEFDTAANLYGSSATSFEDHYNQANSLAMSGQFETALSAYDEALAINPDDEDALFNRDLVEKLLEQQKQAEQEQQQDQQQQQAGGESSEDQQQQQAGGESSEDQQQQQAGGESSDDQQQQQAGGESSEDQQQQQAGGESSEDQQQQQAGGESSEDQQQQQAGGESSEDQQQQQAGGESSEDQQQQQAGGESSEDQQQQQAGGESSQKISNSNKLAANLQKISNSNKLAANLHKNSNSSKLAANHQRISNNKPAENAEDQQQQQAGGESSEDQQQQSADTRNAFQRAMDEILKGNGDADGSEIADQAQDPEQSPTAGQGYSEQDQAIEQQLRAVPDDPSGLLRARIRQHYARQRANRS